MWILTVAGFFSAVEKPEDQARGTVTVRARVEGDIVALCRDYAPGTKWESDSAGTTDYAYRAVLTREEWEAAVAQMAREITYPNFKDEVKRRQGAKRASAYMRVWGALRALQPASGWPRDCWDEPVDPVDLADGRWASGLDDT